MRKIVIIFLLLLICSTLKPLTAYLVASEAITWTFRVANIPRYFSILDQSVERTDTGYTVCITFGLSSEPGDNSVIITLPTGTDP